jgi:hypothetical protein
MHLVGFITRIRHDAGHMNVKKSKRLLFLTKTWNLTRSAYLLVPCA